MFAPKNWLHQDSPRDTTYCGPIWNGAQPATQMQTSMNMSFVTELESVEFLAFINLVWSKFGQKGTQNNMYQNKYQQQSTKLKKKMTKKIDVLVFSKWPIHIDPRNFDRLSWHRNAWGGNKYDPFVHRWASKLEDLTKKTSN